MPPLTPLPDANGAKEVKHAGSRDLAPPTPDSSPDSPGEEGSQQAPTRDKGDSICPDDLSFSIDYSLGGVGGAVGGDEAPMPGPEDARGLGLHPPQVMLGVVSGQTLEKEVMVNTSNTQYCS